jgi:hypothetical protein
MAPVLKVEYNLFEGPPYNLPTWSLFHLHSSTCSILQSLKPPFKKKKDHNSSIQKPDWQFLFTFYFLRETLSDLAEESNTFYNRHALTLMNLYWECGNIWNCHLLFILFMFLSAYTCQSTLKWKLPVPGCIPNPSTALAHSRCTNNCWVSSTYVVPTVSWKSITKRQGTDDWQCIYTEPMALPQSRGSILLALECSALPAKNTNPLQAHSHAALLKHPNNDCLKRK